jgi:hypothetical protein
VENIRYRKIASEVGSEVMVARFRAKMKVNKKTGCHEWQGCRHSNGYGQLRCETVLYYAHRLAWELAHGDVPRGIYVLHKCDNRRCVNPKHMFLGTQADNIADRVAKKRKIGVGAEFTPWRPVPAWRQSHQP